MASRNLFFFPLCFVILPCFPFPVLGGVCLFPFAANWRSSDAKAVDGPTKQGNRGPGEACSRTPSLHLLIPGERPDRQMGTRTRPWRHLLSRFSAKTQEPCDYTLKPGPRSQQLKLLRQERGFQVQGPQWVYTVTDSQRCRGRGTVGCRDGAEGKLGLLLQAFLRPD